MLGGMYEMLKGDISRDEMPQGEISIGEMCRSKLSQGETYKGEMSHMQYSRVTPLRVRYPEVVHHVPELKLIRQYF
jgi:hypothetical protein